ncbi:anhydro-N-acetylmuramic acid kinase [Pontibacillus yanchengensis]|uniref:Anhydro-N-acetylmuramic acid kinase n=1 Tax=Pontibacillus yanchengensis Y32 TaxID=1385514 RepID=A0A0A2TZD6_9BACI|nr:anhydro-N-acetylmuramic acid kinase [Pontibacillus yanchengensis]KGP74640.1 anhydro-N-acetylmuramic acid kinase [Pontibacillus yanchengensis Y32]
MDKKKRLAIGLMSGTSLDGIDAALVEIEGAGRTTKVSLKAFESISYSQEERQVLLALCDRNQSTVDKICRYNVELGKKFAEAAHAVAEMADLTLEDIDFISSHGQTIYHMPDHAATLQIGELSVIAEQTGCLTVGDYRPSDMAVGGQGAPLVPFVDDLLFRDEAKGRILVNIGGISNLSVLEATGSEKGVLALDTGPGNVLIDAVVQIGSQGESTFDENGSIAASGRVDEEWLQDIVDQDDYLKMDLPKTTGRELYTWEMAERLYEEGRQKGLAYEDIVATITAYTVQAISYHIKKVVDPHYDTQEVIVAGGGVHNKTILTGLENNLGQSVRTLDELHFSSDAKEAITFAILGNEYLHGHPNHLPSATGAAKEVSMGKLVLPSALTEGEQ